jgi:hypothetical protein
MNNNVFRDVAPCGFIINRRFGGTRRLNVQSSYRLTLFNSHFISSTLKMEKTRSSETSVPEGGILHRFHCLLVQL